MLLVLSLIGSLIVLLSCNSKQTTGTPSANTKPSQPSTEGFIFGQKGKVVVALLGIEGCSETKRATEVLAKMSADCPNDVALARLDVPIPGQSQFTPLTNWSYNYYQAVDTDRKVANRLEFFYYPTLYIIDRDGEIRYSGSCDEAKLRTMITEIRQEAAGSQKKIYTPPILAIGAPAPVFQAKTFKGEDIDLQPAITKGPVLLFFTSVDCPFSLAAAQKIPLLEKEFAGKEFTIMMIEKGTNTENINDTYQQIELAGMVILDPDNTISRKYNVEPVPFYFVIDKEGKIAARGPYTESSARQALGKLLGMQNAGPKEKVAPGAG